jgi:hypothetical protein
VSNNQAILEQIPLHEKENRPDWAKKRPRVRYYSTENRNVVMKENKAVPEEEALALVLLCGFFIENCIRG